MNVLVTGGAGYIGSHTVVELVKAGMTPVIVDNFSNSNPAVLDRLEEITGQKIEYYDANASDLDEMRRVFAKAKPEAVIHFAAFKAVGESVKQPLKYYVNNLAALCAVLEVMQASDCKQFVFSSSATVYGMPKRVPITEDFPLSAANPYGQTKLMSEQILRDLAVADPALRVSILRYFNPVGAHESGLIGEDPQGKPNNLMPYVAQVAIGRRKELEVFGDDYDTEDGTGVRDYLHVVDLARAHVQAIQRRLEHDEPVVTYNLGTGRGYSVLEMVKAFEKASGRAIPYKIVERRPGDIATCYADPSLAEREIGWKAEKSLDDMCADTWRWQSKNPEGYETATK